MISKRFGRPVTVCWSKLDWISTIRMEKEVKFKGAKLYVIVTYAAYIYSWIQILCFLQANVRSAVTIIFDISTTRTVQKYTKLITEVIKNVLEGSKPGWQITKSPNFFCTILITWLYTLMIQRNIQHRKCYKSVSYFL